MTAKHPQYLDISVHNFTSNYTKLAHGHGVDTQILLKVPVERLTTVRLKGTERSIADFLRSLIGREGWTEGYGWTEGLVEMHCKAIKNLTCDSEAPSHKNRWISEQREKALP